jgi:hypothetical protein
MTLQRHTLLAYSNVLYHWELMCKELVHRSISGANSYLTRHTFHENLKRALEKAHNWHYLVPHFTHILWYIIGAQCLLRDARRVFYAIKIGLGNRQWSGTFKDLECLDLFELALNGLKCVCLLVCPLSSMSGIMTSMCLPVAAQTLHHLGICGFCCAHKRNRHRY